MTTYDIASVVFGIDVDESAISLITMNVVYTVTKCLQHAAVTGLKAEFDKITIHDNTDNTDGRYKIVASSLKDENDSNGITKLMNATIRAATDKNWSQGTIGAGGSSEKITASMAGVSNWNGSISDCLDHLISAALVKNNFKSDSTYDGLTATQMMGLPFVGATNAFETAGDVANDTLSSFGGQIFVDLSNNTGDNLILSSQKGIVADVIRQWTSAQITNQSSETIEDGKKFGDLVAGDKLRFVLQVFGSGTGGLFVFANPSANGVAVAAAAGSSSRTSSIGNVTNTISPGISSVAGASVKPCHFLLEYAMGT